jgi:hypothetical protein
MPQAVTYYRHNPQQLNIIFIWENKRHWRSAPVLKSLLKQIRPESRPEDLTYRLIRVTPSNLRAIYSYAVTQVKNPIVMLDGEPIDHSERGPLRPRRVADADDFEVRDGAHPIMGFHGSPAEMWASDRYIEIVKHCEEQGWLTIK